MPTAEPGDKVQSQPIELTLDALQTPCLLLNEARVRANVGRMRSHLTHLGVAFRPHLKTAKSLDVARIAMTTPRVPPWSRRCAKRNTSPRAACVT